MINDVAKEFTEQYVSVMTAQFRKLMSYNFNGLLQIPRELVVIPDEDFNSLCDKLAAIPYGKSEVIINTALDKRVQYMFSKLVTFFGVDGNPVKAMDFEYHMYPVIVIDCYVYDFLLGINAAPIAEYIDFLFAFNDRIRMSTEFAWIPFMDNLPGCFTEDMYEQIISKDGLSYNYTLYKRKESA